jgi:hypothetical protein
VGLLAHQHQHALRDVVRRLDEHGVVHHEVEAFRLRGIGILRRTSAVRSYSTAGPRAPILRAKSKEQRT